MSDAVSVSAIAKSKVAANKALKSLTIEQAERAIFNLTAATEAARAREAERAEKKKAIAVAKLKTMMSEMGISAADITGSDSTPTAGSRKARKKPGKVPAKYSITVDGETHRWTGRGRTPVVFKNHIEQGGSLDECLI
ncbi:MAG: H-NS histone family protein [Luminiphilus sp.]|nr:H-NS histone family protein [Luminiphilus sp.]